MNGKYVIRDKKKDKWLRFTLTRDGLKLNLEKTFISATLCDTSKGALLFIKEQNFDISHYELYRLKVFAEPISWKEEK